MAYGSRLANQLLGTPFDDKCSVPIEVRKLLTPKEFFDHCYVRPDFMESKTEKGTDEGYEEAADMFAQKVQKDLADMALIRANAHSAFFRWLDDFSEMKVYTISGNAGTGKTTLVNSLRFLRRKEHTEWIILDMFRAVNPIRWYGDYRTRVSDFRQAYGKTYGIVLRTISEILFKHVDVESGEIKPLPCEKARDQLTFLIDNYRNYYEKDNPAGSTFIRNVGKKLSMRGRISERIDAIAAYCADFFSKSGDSKEKFDEALDILLLLLRCSSSDKNTRYIITFDNFERFINDDEIYNKKVDEIRKDLNDYVDGLENHKDVFKFIMAIRSSTIRMCRASKQVSDSLPNDLNIELWYNCDDIIAKRLAWYKSIMKSDVKDTEGFDLVFQIVGDERTMRDSVKTGLKLYIDPLFNYNKRLIIDFISGIVESPNNKGAIKQYEALWNEGSWKKNSISRYGARSIIQGLILETLERQDNLFSAMKASDPRTINPGSGIARRILTILYDYQHDFKNSLMPLTDVVRYYYDLNSKDEAKDYWETMDEEEKDVFSEVLYNMNSYNRRSNDWIQLLDIQIQNQDIDIKLRDSSDLKDLIAENMINMTLHILPAGIVYLTDIVQSFEFFSMRYSKKYYPLFALIPDSETMRDVSDVKSLFCYQVINNTVKCALRCMRELRKSNSDIPLFVERSKYYHINRIRNHHQGYLANFVKHIRHSVIPNCDVSSQESGKYEELCEAIEELAKSYRAF